MLRERSLGENDKFLDILTDGAGLLEVAARGVKKQNSKNASVAQSFCYAEFCISETKGRYILNSAEPIRNFYELRLDVEKLSLASYFAEMTLFVATQERSNSEVLRLILNCLHFLSLGTRENLMLKSVFELRLLSEIGLIPNLLGCCKCLKYADGQFLFDLRGGKLYCENCFGNRDLYDVEPLDGRLLHYIRYIALTDMKKLFSLKVPREYLLPLTNITERYSEIQLDKHFQTLDFYKSMMNGYSYE